MDGFGAFGEVEGGVEVFEVLEGVPGIVQLAAVENSDWDAGVLVNISRDTSDGTNNLNSRDYLAKYDMFAIEMRSWLKCNEELRRVGVSA